MSNIYLVTISFNLNKQLTAEEQDKVWSLMWQFESSLYKYGNTLNPSEFFLTETGFIKYAAIPDKNALSDNNIAPYGLVAKEQLKKMGVVISYNILAKHVTDSDEIIMEQNIDNAEFLILYHSNLLRDYESQLILRTDQGKYLPTYMLNNNEDPHLAADLTFWIDDYAAIDRLWISSYKKLEPIMAKQKANLDSDISIEGLKIRQRYRECFKQESLLSASRVV
jgi:predicted  nucleic acid-binding Zn ribbon protein